MRRRGRGVEVVKTRAVGPTEVRLRGKVEAVYPEKGFGFLAGDDGVKRFFHASACEVALSGVRPGQWVSFLHTEGPKGPRGIEVRMEEAEGNR